MLNMEFCDLSAKQEIGGLDWECHVVVQAAYMCPTQFLSCRQILYFSVLKVLQSE